MKKRVVIITDCSDIAYSELRGSILSVINDVDDIEIEPVIAVQPLSIINGNFVLRLMAEVYPPETIFSIILNPLKDRPERIMGTTKKKNYKFIGANTGVFEWFLKDFGVAELYELNDPGFFPFGGKYVHAPAVAEIAMGKSLANMGSVFNESLLRSANYKDNMIIHIDNFGLMKINLKVSDFDKYLLQEGAPVILTIGNSTINAVFSKRMMSNEDDTWVIYPGSSLGLIEIGKVRSNGAKEVGAKVGDVIKISIVDSSSELDNQASGLSASF